MNGEAEVSVASEPGRARPLSGGLWSLLSWLRRDDRSSSSDSLSSAGSDRTAVSFAFLAPSLPRTRDGPLPPLAPPTDSYRKRVRDRNQRRQHDRDLTLHRKYGLYYGYDALSLPPARRNLNESSKQDRDRRANSESLPRRSAHVPGKRRAPLPPARAQSVTPTTSSLVRRHNRKRPAPQPPAKSSTFKENSQISETDILIQMDSKSDLERFSLSNGSGCKSEKYGKKDSSKQDTKPRREKSFLKQIFENKKRNSTNDPVPERLLPSISELDKQAAEIIESCKLKPIEQNNNSQRETWFCTRCLRKFDCTVVTCQHCLPEQKKLSNGLVGLNSAAASSIQMQTEKELLSNASTNKISGIEDEEKQKLKEMLKEMKDSLPKRPKHDSNKKNVFAFESEYRKSTSLEAPTLRIGSTIIKESELNLLPQPSTSKQSNSKNTNMGIPKVEKILPKIKPEPVTENVVITQHVVLISPSPTDRLKSNNTTDSVKISEIATNEKRSVKQPNTELNKVRIEPNNIHIPLKISSLLNPVFIPKSQKSELEVQRSLFITQRETREINPENSSTSNSVKPSTSIAQSSTSQVSSTTQNIQSKDAKSSITEETPGKIDPLLKKQEAVEEFLKQSSSTVPASLGASVSTASVSGSNDKTRLINSNMMKFTVDQHSRRRELINQLEKSISSGDERAAADAAVKLAQLRLSCSVLSFTSQIIADSPKAVPMHVDQHPSASSQIKESIQKASPQPSNKVNEQQVQSSATVSTNTKIKNKQVLPIKRDVQEPTSSSLSESKPKQGNNEDNSRKQLLPQPSTSKETLREDGSNITTIEVWVEDRETTRGPVHLRIPRQAVMRELRQQAETSLGLASAMQRWIVGRVLCTDDRTSLVTLAGPNLSAPFYLCVVESDNTAGSSHVLPNEISENIIKTSDQVHNKASDVYSELVQLEKRALVVNTEPFECTVCMEECVTGGGAVLRECVHTFCRECLSDLIRHCEEPAVTCPAMGCPGFLQEREIRALVTPEEYDRWLARGLAAAESGTRNAFHCRTRDCTGWALCDPGVRRFPCPVCKRTNCIPCQAIHEGLTCEKHRAKQQEVIATSVSDQTDKGTEALLQTLITKGEALKCPECSAIITKKWGCDWVKCSACKTEICWVTRGRRWGPAGKGDTSGGCRCGVDGKKCHPSCGYCH